MTTYTKNPAKTYIDTNWKDFSNILDEHAVLLLVISVGWSPIWQRVRAFIKHASGEIAEHSSKELLTLLNSLNEAVAFKNDRVTAEVNCLLTKGDFSALDIFTISSPEKQIEELVKAIYDYFTVSDPECKYKINLSIIDDGIISEIKFHLPRISKVKTPLTTLNDENSAIRIAARTKKIVVIEDVKKELGASKPRFVTHDDVETSPGSLICFPITSDLNKTVIYVISIYCNTPGKFQELKSHKDYYKRLLSFFELRFKLEHSYLVLKGVCK